jgi:translation initiation factor 4E
MTSVANQSPVPLDTIPISPENSNGNGIESLDRINRHESAAPVTVFHNPDNFNVKHPLMHKWTLWFTKPPSGKVSQTLTGS